MNWAALLNPQFLLASVGALLLAAALGGWGGYHQGTLAGRAEAAEAHAQLAERYAAIAEENEAHGAKVRAQEAAAAASTTRHANELRKKNLDILTLTVALAERAPTYVTPAADRACIVPRGFVCHYDGSLFATSAEEFPRATCGPVDADTGIPLSRVSAGLARNNGVARACCAEARTWRAWWVEQAAIQNGNAQGPSALAPSTTAFLPRTTETTP